MTEMVSGRSTPFEAQIAEPFSICTDVEYVLQI